jgi:hypothetical protein
MAPVSGKVTLDGQTVTSGQVSFLTADAKATPGVGTSGGTIDSSGQYTIYTSGKAGAPLGTYKVTVSPSTVPTPGATSMPTPFGAKYQDIKTTPFTFEVINNPEPGRYDLKLTK